MILHGVDFSGADSGGAAKIRMVSRDLDAPGSAVRQDGRFDRGALVRRILAMREDGRRHLVRIDAPVGLPLDTLRSFEVTPEWGAMAEWIAGFGSPRLWRGEVRGVDRREPKRVCDTAFRTPMAPMNLRVFKQTWTFACEVLLPLAAEGVRIEPCAGDPAAPVRIAEGCPSTVLHLNGWPRRGYKGAGEPPRQVRAGIVANLRSTGMVIPDALADEAVRDEEGDLVDALLLVTDPVSSAPPAVAQAEGWVY